MIRIAFNSPSNRVARMKLTRWVRFSWALENLSDAPAALDPHYRIRTAVQDEEETVRKVVFTAFSLDMDWTDSLKSLREGLDRRLDAIFGEKEVPCLVITHGARIIAASALDGREGVDNHLITGPCVLSEYRNRGLGSALLFHSLVTLQKGGLKRAFGVSKDNVPAAKFLYPKFGSACEPYVFEPQLAA
jgi:predicted N-acetyltransferase YhbS